MIWSSRERNRSCSLLSRRSRGRIAKFPRSISSSEKNHGLRFEGILKIDLQGNRPPKAKNRQIRLLERAQSSSLFNSFLNSSRATIYNGWRNPNVSSLLRASGRRSASPAALAYARGGGRGAREDQRPVNFSGPARV